jgi:F0F1-type ATP synthase gamma subunit
MTDRLRMQANRLRQQEITEELLDVVGGAEALR